MCNVKIKLCKCCSGMNRKEEACSKFEEYKITTNNANMSVDSGEWLEMHGIESPNNVQVSVMMTSCPQCKSLKKPKAPVVKLVMSLEEGIADLVGTFKVYSTKGALILGPWTKTTRQQVMTDVETDGELDTDAEI